MSDLERRLDEDYKKKVIIFAERPMQQFRSGKVINEPDLTFANQARDWAEWNPDYDTKIIPFYGAAELDESLRLLGEDEWLESDAEAMVMGHSDSSGMYGGVMPGLWEHLLDENFISDKINKVTLGSCTMGENPLACSALADAFEAPVSGQLGQSWGSGAIPEKYHGEGTLEERTFVPNWGEADYATYTKNREEALDVYSGFRPNQADPKALEEGLNRFEAILMMGGNPGMPMYKDIENRQMRPFKIRDMYNIMTKDTRFDNEKVDEILMSSPDGHDVQMNLINYYRSTLEKDIPVRVLMQGVRN
jgi:hypothetical protein